MQNKFQQFRQSPIYKSMLLIVMNQSSPSEYTYISNVSEKQIIKSQIMDVFNYIQFDCYKALTMFIMVQYFVIR